MVAVAGRLSDLDREIERLRALRISGVLLRFYHHAGENERKEARTAFDRLSAAGFDIRVALVQDRKAVKHPDDWERFCRETLTHVRGRVRWVEFAHAVNRVKWGAWGFEDYRRLCEGLPALKKEFADISFAGPAVIDFDPAFALAALDALPKGVGWDAFSVHLYVDRRGAPENRQALLDLPGKLELMRAIARRAGMGDDRVIISEFNWPLAGTGVWSPVGSPYVSPGERVNDPSVSEEDYARFLVRYLLLALASGHVRDCVIWRLTAHGFGLVDDRDPGPWRPRPAFYALEVLLRFLDGAIFRRAWTPCRAPGVFALEFEGSRTGRTIVAWSHPADSDYLCPFQPEAVFDMFGNRMAADSPVVGLDASPVYLLEKQITDL